MDIITFDGRRLRRLEREADEAEAKASAAGEWAGDLAAGLAQARRELGEIEAENNRFHPDPRRPDPRDVQHKQLLTQRVEKARQRVSSLEADYEEAAAVANAADGAEADARKLFDACAQFARKRGLGAPEPFERGRGGKVKVGKVGRAV